jgi:hypothetical protein
MMSANLQVSVVLACLDEAGSVGAVVSDALQTLSKAGLHGEVIVTDNGSTDGSAALAAAAGARVVDAPLRGYGNAYHVGMATAQGDVLVMADADGTYPMEEIPALVGPVLSGEQDLVLGSRLRGDMEARAMPWTHRHIGTPVLTRLLKWFTGVSVSDAQSGMRAIDARAYSRLQLCTPGMEYASEMLVQAARAGLRITEVPIVYRARVGDSKLDAWPDGWRHLKFLLLASPTWLFVLPGLLSLVLGGVLVVPLAFGEVHIGRFQMILHPMVPGAILMVVGFQMVQFGLLVRGCSASPVGVEDRLASFIRRRLTLERVLLAGAVLILVALAILLAILVEWARSGFGPLTQLRHAIAAMVVLVIGSQTVFGAFVYAFFLPTEFGGVPRPQVIPGRVETENDAR